MPAKRILILFLLISLAGHLLLLLSISKFTDMAGGDRENAILTVNLKNPGESSVENQEEKKKVESPRSTPLPEEANGDKYPEKTVALNSRDDRYLAYLRKIKKKIERIWTYPQKAFQQKEEGVAVIKFSITRSGALLEPFIITSSGSELLDGETLGTVKAAAPYDPLPPHFNLAKLNIVAEFQYRLNE